MITSSSSFLWVGLIVLVCLAQPTLAFGAGNIASLSKVEGVNWRHGDIEDALLNIAMARALKGKNFSKLMVSRVYFGNWLRDYSQAVDVGTVKSVSAEAIRLVLCVLGFLTFGYGSKEFQVTADRLGCYRPEEHIDNPKNYADNEDARRYDRRLRGPVDEGVELAVDPETGMKNYIANEKAGIMTSAKLLRDLLGNCIELGRKYGRNQREEDLFEALRLLGTGLHCLEDFFAHSNYIELALIEKGERDIFAHVGRDTGIRLQGARDQVFPLVTGTFGGVDFLHSVTGEVTDKLKQNELQELENTLQENKNNDTSMLRNLLDMIPDGIFGGKHQSDRVDEIQQNCNSSQMQNMEVSPRDPEEFTRYVQDIFKQIMPLLEFHDDIMQNISEKFEKIPVLPKILEQLEEQMTKFVYTNLAPFILPVIHQIQNEMKTGSQEIVESSEREQHIVFNDNRSSDPTHSMLSKDHFTNLLNEPAGRTASEMIGWVVPQIMSAIDDENIDVNQTLTRIIYGVFHHPAQRDQGNDGISEGRKVIFGSIEKWWESLGRQGQDDYRRKLSRDGVKNNENHKPGVHDTGHGHGCNGKLQMHKQFGGKPETWEDKVADKAAGAIITGATGAISGIIEQTTGVKVPSYKQPERKEEKQSSGAGGLLGAASSIFGEVFGNDEKEKTSSSHKNNDGSYTQTQTEYGHSGNKYAQAQKTETQYPDGGRRTEYKKYEQEEQSGGRTSGHGYEEKTETRPSQSGGYEQRTERHEYQGSSSGYGGRQEQSSYGGRQEESSYGGRQEQSSYGGRQESSGYGGRQEQSSYGGRQESSGYGGRQEQSSYGGREESSGYGGRQQESSYGGREESSGYGGRQQESSYGSRQESSYGSRQESSHGGREEQSSYGGRQESSGYGGREEQSSYGGRQESSGYGGREEQSSYGGGGGYGGRQEESYGGRQEESYGGGHGRNRSGERNRSRERNRSQERNRSRNHSQERRW
ncbi:hypothetical protein HYQ45_018050 [Verticillium longisporum]|uniref:Het-C-domain-containing protein n=1 Tax=Verticillium longisporum TaxID=100787 RepID=A0A8I2Z3R8_VERLO|nr:hypothetical protein HYQ45_018050 [Verticillium longisporum]